MLQQANVAGHKSRGGETHDLPQREIPRHHGEHDAKRHVLSIRSRCAHRTRVDGFIRKERLRMFGIKPHTPRALAHLFSSRPQRLAHLQRHDHRNGFILGVNQISRAVHQRRTLEEGRKPITLELFVSNGYCRLDLGRCVRLECSHDLTRCGVLCHDCHGTSMAHRRFYQLPRLM